MIPKNGRFSIPQLVEQAAVNYPDLTAFSDGAQQFSFSQWHALIGNNALYLETIINKPQQRLGIFMHRCMAMLQAVYAIQAYGAAYVPADPDHPQQRVLGIFQDAGIRYVLTSSDFKELVVQMGFIPVILEMDLRPNSFQSQTLAHQAAYVLFTSGSTGTPKGVEIAHESVTNLLYYMQDHYPLAQGDCLLFKSPYTFDGSVWEIYGGLINGSCVFIAPIGAEKEPAQLWNILVQHSIHFAFFVPAMLQAFTEYLQTIQANGNQSVLKWISVGGEVLQWELIRQFHQIFDIEQTVLINVYGPTETTVYATTWRCDPAATYSKVPIGSVVSGNRIYLFNPQQELVPEGAEGEIYIAGTGVGLGYLNNPELNAKHFLDDPFFPGQKMYRTGDTGKWLNDSLLEFTGRIDHQVKLRGLRIETGEIETKLLQIPQVFETVVTMEKDRHNDDVLVAFLRLNTSHENAAPHLMDAELETQFRTQLQAVLPGFMIPGFFVSVPEFQLTAHGKIDRKKLPTEIIRTGNRNIETNSQWTPEDETERFLQEVWTDLLGIQVPNSTTDFFSLGGHSLKVVQTITAILSNYGVPVSFSQFYQMPTIRALAGYIRLQQGELKATTHKPVPLDIITGWVGEGPITPVQEEMWIIHKMDPSGRQHNILIEFTINGQFDPIRLEHSLNELLHQLPSMNSSFPILRDAPVQVFHQNQLPANYKWHFWHSVSEQEKTLRFQQALQRVQQTPIDPQVPPLFLVEGFHWDAGHSKVLFCIHHILFDGWSLQRFISYWKDIYEGKSFNGLLLHPAPYAKWLRNAQSEQQLQHELNWWRNTLPPIPPLLTLPRKINQQPNQRKLSGNRHWFTIDTTTTKILHDWLQVHSITPFVWFTSLFHWTLSMYSRQQHIHIGTPFAQRQHPDSVNLIGYYTNMLILSLKQEDQDTPMDFLNRTRNCYTEAIDHSLLPFGKLVRELNYRHPSSDDFGFQAIIVLLNWSEADRESSPFVIHQTELGNGTSKTDLMLNIEPVDEGYRCWLEFDTALFEASWVREFACSFQRILKNVLEQPNQLLHKLKQLPDVIPAPRCWLIGDGTMALRALEILEDQGAPVTAVISSDPGVQAEAASRGILMIPSPQELLDSMQAELAFSVNNSWILKPDFLKRITGKAINFHDSLLPDYAGLYASSWAILNQEKTHGISWHEVTTEIDGGAVFNQQPVTIHPATTAHDLNLLCFEQALKALTECLPDWFHLNFSKASAGSAPLRYFSQQQRPAHWGWLHPNWNTEMVMQICRACYFSEGLENPFLIPAIIINQELYFIRNLPEPSGEAIQPGHILTKDGRFHIGFKDGVIQFNTLTDSSGANANPIPEENRPIRWQQPAEADLTNLTQRFRKFSRYEKYWVNQLNLLDTTLRDAQFFTRYRDYEHPTITDSIPREQLPYFLYYLARIYDQPLLPCCYLPPEEDRCIGINHWVPMLVTIHPHQTLQENIAKIQLAWELNQKAGSYLTSVPARYPSVPVVSDSEFPVYVVYDNQASGLRTGIPQHHAIIQIQPSACRLSGFSEPLLRGYKWFFEQTATELHRSCDIPLIEETTATATTKDQEDILQRIWKQAHKHPQELALTGSRCITYEMLLYYVQFRAAELQNAGIQNGHRIAVPAISSPEYVITLLALLYLEASFVPVDMALPELRLEQMLQQCSFNGFADWRTKPENLNQLPNRIQVTELGGIPNLKNDVLLISPLPAESTSEAYILFTSGSSGTPKGVRISRNNLNCFVTGGLSAYPVTSKDRWYQFANLSFDTSIEELFIPLCSGGSLCIPLQKNLEFDRLNEYLRGEQITVMDFPTGYWRQWMQERSSAQLLTQHLKLIILGGEALMPDDVHYWQELKPSCTLINSYGPTECTVVALTEIISNSYSSGTKQVPIGKPLHGYHARVTDAYGHTIPAGTSGVLQLSGNGISNGYLLQPNKSAAIQNSIQTNTYATGDRVIEDYQGKYYFLGRADQQVKIRGFRIEPEELRQLLINHSQVQDAAVMIEQTDAGDKELIALLATTCNPEDASFRDQLLQNVPAWMKPSKIYSLPKLPLTANGKIDYKSLQHYVLNQKQASAEPAETDAPIGPFEHTLHQIWCTTLKRDTLNVASNFFEHGGHSLLAVRLIAQIKKEFDIELPLASLLSHGTIRDQAKLLESRKIDHLWDLMVPIRARGNKSPLFLIHGAGLNVLLYQSIAGHLDPQRPVYALQARGLDGKTAIATRIEDMAADYIREIKKVQPDGPYYLLGYSIGGFIVYEIARQLLQQNESVRMAGVIDTLAGNGYESKNGLLGILQKINHHVQKFRFIIGTILKQKGAGKLKLLNQKRKNFQVLFRYMLFKLNLLKEADLRKNQGKGHGYYMADAATIAMLQALNTYSIKPLPITIDLFKAADSTIYVPDREFYGWKLLAENGVVVHSIPGDHADMFAPPNDKQFAAILDQRLRELENTSLPQQQKDPHHEH